jgi:hypothetical protein
VSGENRVKLGHTGIELLQALELCFQWQAVLQEKPDQIVVIVSSEQQLVRRIQQHDFARGMPRRFDYLDPAAAQIENVAIFHRQQLRCLSILSFFQRNQVRAATCSFALWIDRTFDFAEAIWLMAAKSAGWAYTVLNWKLPPE